MRILNPKKSFGSSGVTVSESGDLSFIKAPECGASKFEKLKKSMVELSSEQKDINTSYRRSNVKKEKKSKQQCGVSNYFDSVFPNNISTEDAVKKEYSYLYNKGIHLLSMREHSVKEVTTKLSAKSERLDLVSAVIDELLEKNYLSNSRFTESYVRAKQQRGFGPTKIRNELTNKNIKNSMIDHYLDAGSAVWYENAQNQYTKKYGDEPIRDYNTWTKRARFMQSRGFTMEHIHSTLPPVDSD